MVYFELKSFLMLPHDWESWKEHSGVPREFAEKLNEIAERNGSDVSLWRASFEPIEKDKWITIERWDKRKGF